jgi:hypothetical protein
MFDARRPKGRLFYLVLMVMAVTLGVRLGARGAAAAEEPTSSPKAKPGAAESAPLTASPAPQTPPALTSVVDTVFSADGTAAQGVLVISWPAFVTASGTAVAAGVLDTTLGANGALNVGLVPNAGATPAGAYYSVVYQLGPLRPYMSITRSENFKTMEAHEHGERERVGAAGNRYRLPARSIRQADQIGDKDGRSRR